MRLFVAVVYFGSAPRSPVSSRPASRFSDRFEFLLTARKAKHPVLYNSAQAAQLLTCHQSSLAHQAPQLQS